MSSVQLITAAKLPSFDWPQTVDGDYARRYFRPLMQQGPQAFIDNVFNTEIRILALDKLILPLTLTDFHPENSYVCSAYSHYFSYGAYEEVKHLGQPILTKTLPWFLRPFDTLFQVCAFDKVVFINNWLLSTNLYPKLDSEQLQAVIKALPELFPDRVLVFRSVDAYKNPDLYSLLLEQGYRMILSRQVYYQNPERSFKKRQINVDQKLMRQSPYRIEAKQALSDTELKRMVTLYRQLYLDKYSSFNPQFNERFIRHLLENQLIYVRMLVRDNRMDGVLAYFVRNGVMTQPIFGYDLSLPQALGLYRILSLQTLIEAQQRGLEVHASAGVGAFKRLRGGVRVSEYNAVFDQHLPKWRRLPWQILEQLSQKIAVPLFIKHGF